MPYPLGHINFQPIDGAFALGYCADFASEKSEKRGQIYLRIYGENKSGKINLSPFITIRLISNN